MAVMHSLTRAQLRELHMELERERARHERAMLLAEASAIPGDMTAIERAQLRLDTVGAALRRLADGTYGSCHNCGEPIPYARLLVIPEATHCRGCNR